MKYLVFTYGTLMKEERNHPLIEDQRYVCDATLENYGLYEIGTYPGAVPMDGFNVYGEIYEVDDEAKARVDRLECEGELYEYKMTDVITETGVMNVGFYEYMDKETKRPIRKPSGKWNMSRQDI